jgi:hypothetical protein
VRRRTLGEDLIKGQHVADTTAADRQHNGISRPDAHELGGDKMTSASFRIAAAV